MTNLLFANLTHYPARTCASMFGVAIGVLLVVVTVGLVRGQLRERGARDTNLTVELMLSQTSQSGISFTTIAVTLPMNLLDEVRGIEGVSAVTPVAQHVEFGGAGALGLRQIDGVDFAAYQRTTGVHIVAGQPLPEHGDALVVDVKYATATKTSIGDKLKLLDREFTVVGVYAPETGARLMIPLKTMQEALSAPAMCSMFLVKCVNPAEQEAVAYRIATHLPDARILFTRDLPTLFATGFSGFNIFLKAVAALGALISMLIVLLTSYTTVSERTRQIGIMKALGASRWFIALAFLKESLLISSGGIAGGLLLSWLSQFALKQWNGTHISFERDYIALAVMGGLLFNLLGALYPAWHAAGLDAVDSLSYE